MQAEFESILHELSVALGVELQVDSHGVCRLKMQSEVSVQLEWSNAPVGLLMFAKLGELPGTLPLRRALLRAALRANAPDQLPGPSLCYSDVHRQLMLQRSIAPERIEVAQLLALIEELEATALVWIEALRSGRPPLVYQSKQRDPDILKAAQWSHEAR